MKAFANTCLATFGFPINTGVPLHPNLVQCVVQGTG